MTTTKKTVFEVALQITKRLNLLPEKGKKDEYFEIKAFMLVPIFSLVPLGCFLHLFHIFYTNQPKILEDIIEDISLIVSTCSMYYAVIVFMLQGRNIASLIENLEDYSRFGKPPDTDESIKHLHLLAYSYQIYSYCGVLITAIVANLERKLCETKNVKYHTDNICGLFTPAWMPFSIEQPPVKQIYFAIVFISAIWLASSSVCCISVLFTCIRCIISKIYHLMDLFSTMFNYKTVKERKQHLTYNIRYQLYIYKLSDKLYKCFGTMLMIHMFFCSLILSLLGFKLLVHFTLSILIHMVGWTIALATLCYSGERLNHESMRLSIVLYETNWYDQDISLQRDIVIVLLRLNRPIYLRVTGSGTMCFITLQTILTTSYQYLAVLKQIL